MQPDRDQRSAHPAANSNGHCRPTDGPKGSTKLYTSVLSLNPRYHRRSVEKPETWRPDGPRWAHSGARWGPLGAHWAPFWGPFGVGRIIPLRFQGIGRKSAFGARGAHWGPPGCHKVSEGVKTTPPFPGPHGPFLRARCKKAQVALCAIGPTPRPSG